MCIGTGTGDKYMLVDAYHSMEALMWKNRFCFDIPDSVCVCQIMNDSSEPARVDTKHGKPEFSCNISKEPTIE